MIWHEIYPICSCRIIDKNCSNNQNTSISHLVCTIFTSNGLQQLMVNASLDKASLFIFCMLALYTTVLWYLYGMVLLSLFDKWSGKKTSK